MKIVIVNAHWNNRGDEAALCALVESVYDIVSEACIGIIFKETQTVPFFPFEGKIPYITTGFRPSEAQVKAAVNSSGMCEIEDMKKEMLFLDGADLVIYAPGGSVVSDRFWRTKQLEYLFPVAYAQSRNIKTFLAAPSVGPFTEKYDYRSRILSGVERICLRESIGLAELKKEIGNTGETRCMVSCDMAFVGKNNWKKAAEEFREDMQLQSYLNIHQKTVGVTITDLGWNVGYLNENEIKQKIRTAFTLFIRWLLQKGYGVILIPQLFGELNDEDYLKGYQKECNGVFVLDSAYDSSFQQYLTGRLYAVAGLRYHSNIFAARMGTVFIPVIYEQKMRGFCEDGGICDWSVEAESISFEILKERFETLVNNYEEMSQILKEKSRMWTERARLTVQELEKILSERSFSGE